MQVGLLVRGATAAVVLSIGAAQGLQAQVLYNNGSVVDGGGRSILRSGSTVFGFGSQTNSGNSVADNFAVGDAGWNVTQLSFFAYQTGATSFTFTGLSWSIVAGDVNAGTIVASGSSTPTNGGLTGYRVTSTALTNTQRPIFQLDLDVPDFAIGGGNYWLRWSLEGSLASGPWQPPTSDGAIGNAAQSINGGAYQSLVDNNEGVELPFLIHGTTTTVPEPSTWTMMAAGGLALVGISRRRRRQTA